MALLEIGSKFPAEKMKGIDGKVVEFPAIFTQAPATVVFFYRGQW